MRERDSSFEIEVLQSDVMENNQILYATAIFHAQTIFISPSILSPSPLSTSVVLSIITDPIVPSRPVIHTTSASTPNMDTTTAYSII